MKFLRSFLRRYFCRETVGSVTKCRLFSQASFIQATAQKSGLTFESLFIKNHILWQMWTPANKIRSHVTAKNSKAKIATVYDYSSLSLSLLD